MKGSHHDPRRTFGRIAHEAGIDLVQLQHLYGHRSVDMTAQCLGLDAERMREGLERYAAFLAVRSGGPAWAPPLPSVRPPFLGRRGFSLERPTSPGTTGRRYVPLLNARR